MDVIGAIGDSFIFTIIIINWRRGAHSRRCINCNLRYLSFVIFNVGIATKFWRNMTMIYTNKMIITDMIRPAVDMIDCLFSDQGQVAIIV